MSQSDKNQQRREEPRVQNQPGGEQSWTPQPRTQGEPTSESIGTIQASAQVVALERQHPGPATYVRIAVVLAVITAVEVLVYYADAFRPFLVPTLLLLSALKFSLVVAFYMHLRFDSKVFRTLFAFGLVVAATILVALLLINSYHGPVPGAGVA